VVGLPFLSNAGLNLARRDAYLHAASFNAGLAPDAEQAVTLPFDPTVNDILDVPCSSRCNERDG